MSSQEGKEKNPLIIISRKLEVKVKISYVKLKEFEAKIKRKLMISKDNKGVVE